MKPESNEERKTVLPFGLKDLKPASKVDEHKLTAFQLAPAKKNALEKAKEKAQRKTEREAAETAAVLQDFQAEYGHGDYKADINPNVSFKSSVEQPSRGKRARSDNDQVWESEAGPEDEERARARRRQKSGASFLGELRSNHQRRERFENPGVDILDVGDRTNQRPTTLHLSALAPETSQSKLLDMLREFGEILAINILPASTDDIFKHGVTAICSFQVSEAADAAKAALDGRYVGEGFRIIAKFSQDKLNLSNAQADERPFGAQSKIVNLSRVAPPSALQGSSIQRSGQLMEIHVQRPHSVEMVRRIHGVIQQILIHGPSFEALLRHSQAHNPNFEFLYDQACEDAQYFRYMLYLAYQSSSTSVPRHEIHLFDTNTRWFPPVIAQEDEDSDLDTDYQDAIKKSSATAALLSHQARLKLWHLLRTISTQRKAIARIMAFAMTHTSCGEEIADMMSHSVMSESVDWKISLNRLWAVSDVLHNSSLPVPNAWRYRALFERHLPVVFSSLRDTGDRIESRIRRENFRRLVLAILDMWSTWICFGDGAVETFRTNFAQNKIAKDKSLSSGNDGHLDSAAAVDSDPDKRAVEVENGRANEDGYSSTENPTHDAQSSFNASKRSTPHQDTETLSKNPSWLKFNSRRDTEEVKSTTLIPTLGIEDVPGIKPITELKQPDNTPSLAGTIQPKIKLSFGGKVKAPYKPKYEAAPASVSTPPEVLEARPNSELDIASAHESDAATVTREGRNAERTYSRNADRAEQRHDSAARHPRGEDEAHHNGLHEYEELDREIRYQGAHDNGRRWHNPNQYDSRNQRSEYGNARGSRGARDYQDGRRSEEYSTGFRNRGHDSNDTRRRDTDNRRPQPYLQSQDRDHDRDRDLNRSRSDQYHRDSSIASGPTNVSLLVPTQVQGNTSTPPKEDEGGRAEFHSRLQPQPQSHSQPSTQAQYNSTPGQTARRKRRSAADFMD